MAETIDLVEPPLGNSQDIIYISDDENNDNRSLDMEIDRDLSRPLEDSQLPQETHMDYALVVPKKEKEQEQQQKQDCSEEDGFKENYASDENTIYVCADVYARETENVNKLVQDVLSTEREIRELESKANDKLLEARTRKAKLTQRLEVMAEFVDKLRVKEPENSKLESELDVKPSWSHLYAGMNRYRDKASGSVAEFYLHKSNIISGLKTLFEPDGPPMSSPEFAEQPKALLVQLLKHQQMGLKWLQWRETQKVRGGILADDMGLGKTLSMIALVLASHEKQQKTEYKTDGFDYERSWLKQLQLHKQRKRIKIFDDSSEEEEEKKNNKMEQQKIPVKQYYDEENDFISSDNPNGVGGTLVICPMSVMSQWAAEVKSKVAHNTLKVIIYHGSNRRQLGLTKLRCYNIVITSYNTVLAEWQRWGGSSYLFALNWQRLILDEAHIIRNTKTACCTTVGYLQANCRWALTGTPIQNSALDCFALMKFLKVPNFTDLQLWRRYLNFGLAGHRRMSFLIKPLMLRRTKVELQKSGDMPALPPLQVKICEVTFSSEEMAVYQILSAISLKIFAQFVRQREQNNSDLNYYQNEGSAANFMDGEDADKYKELYDQFLCSIGYNLCEKVKGIVILVLLLRLRQFCCHPTLMVKMLRGEVDESDSDEEDLQGHEELNIDALAKIENYEEQQNDKLKESAENIAVTLPAATSKNPIDLATAMKLLQPSNPIFEFSVKSAKLKMILSTVEELLRETNDKIIIVSQWTTYLSLIKQHLELSLVNSETVDFNGKLNAAERSQALSEFQDMSSNKRILLLSLMAGGVGLNLNVANHLLLVDLHWNPQLESQAQDRIYRYGQQKPAFIYRFICKDSIEMRIKALQDYKREIANVVLNNDKMKGTTSGNSLSLKDLKALFGMTKCLNIK